MLQLSVDFGKKSVTSVEREIQRAFRAQQTQGPGRPSPRSRYQKSTHAIENEPDEYRHLLNNLEVHNVNKSSSDVIWVDV
jgi:hypothetical protein